MRMLMRLRVRGTVQGVGFRPFVYRRATALALGGFVRNEAGGVLIEVEGLETELSEFRSALCEHPPPLCRIDTVEVVSMEPSARGDEPGRFTIAQSSDGGGPGYTIGPDSAACEECLAEVEEPSNRRHRYAFTNCTNCGPRYTIVRTVPYDRSGTTMSGFEMCPRCAGEYEDPGDRRFHAQPNACGECGPRLRFTYASGGILCEADDAVEEAAVALRSGRILAVKGLGGYHIAADATDELAVAELRRRKARDEKPFALMVAGIDVARRLCVLDAVTIELLLSPRRPIVLAPRRRAAAVASGIAPGLVELGLMLPYTPLHHLLCERVGRPLVMTSGNLSDDPIVHEDDDAFERLGTVVDGMLFHDRAIHVRCDDSVLRVAGGRRQLLRRSRGYVPEGIPLPGGAGRAVVAVGAELKSTVCLATDGILVPSQHLGDLGHLEAYEAFLQAITHLSRLFGVEPALVAHDLHPEFLSTKYAIDSGFETVAVQHHHAHVASCMVDHGRTAKVLGIAFDGLGLGTDGTLWGGEFLVADLREFERVGHLAPIALPGGTSAIREPWRMAVAWARAAAGSACAQKLGRSLDPRSDRVLAILERGAQPTTTSAGRLFDAVAALLGVRGKAGYEGQAAAELEALAHGVEYERTDCYPAGSSRSEGMLVLDPAPLIATVIEEVSKGASREAVAAGFHRGLATATALAAARLAEENHLDTTVLTGGVFQNVLFSRWVEETLVAEGLRVLVHRDIPPNDGGISIGQAAVAANR